MTCPETLKDLEFSLTTYLAIYDYIDRNEINV